MHRQRVTRDTWTVLASLWFVIGLQPSTAAAEAVVTPNNVQSGSLLLREPSGFRTATRMNTSVDARVSGIVARVSVRQEFRNDGQDWVEGVYVFPLPDSAAVDHLRMYIGDRFIEGEIREKAQARKEYEAAKASGRKASLVEQQRANLFTTNVANIAPGEVVTIEIEYLETLRFDEGLFSLRVPMTITPRYVPGAEEPAAAPQKIGAGLAASTNAAPGASNITPPMVGTSPDHKLTFTADLNAGVPLELISSRYHVIDVVNLGGRYHINLADGLTAMDHDLELTWKPVPSGMPRAMLFTETVGGDPHALLMMLPPDDMLAPLQTMPRELVFVIDTSGSMHGTSIEQAQRALGLALSGLNPSDRFNVIQFNNRTSSLFQSSVAATPSNVSMAQHYVAGLTANGGTEMVPPIRLALTNAASSTHLRQVIFITDGAVGNEDQLYGLIEQHLGNARLFTVGIGSAPNSWFMRKAAEAGRGTFTVISALHEVNEKMQRLFRKLEQPQVTDITVQWPTGIVAERFPATVPDLYAGEPIVVKARLSGQARPGGLVMINGSSALGSWGAQLPLSIGESESGIAALWARARIEDLLDRMRRGASEDDTRKAVVETALTHHLVSRYTSLVAVDKSPVRPSATGLTKDRVANLMAKGQAGSATLGFPATATDSRLHLLTGVLLMLAAMGLLVAERRRRDHVASMVAR